MVDRTGQRPCRTPNTEGCWFHRLVEETQFLYKAKLLLRREDEFMLRRKIDATGIVPSTFDVEPFVAIKAIVEFPDGTLRRVDPEQVQFIDREEG